MKRAQAFEGEDQYLDTTGTGYLMFEVTETSEEHLSFGITGALLSFEASLKSKEGEPDFSTALFDQSAIDNVADSVEVSNNLIPVLNFDQVAFKDLRGVLKQGHSVMVNYTVYVSKKEEVSRYKSYCDNFHQEEIEEKLGDRESQGFSVVEYISNNFSKAFNPFNQDYSIDMPMLTFGEVYYARLVARVSVLDNDKEEMNFPRTRETVLRYTGVQFKAADYTWAVYSILLLAIGTVLVFIGVFVYKNQSWEGMMRYRFLRAFL